MPRRMIHHKSLLPLEEIEKAISSILACHSRDSNPTEQMPLKNSDFLEIANLLKLAGKRDWSLRPRTYALLQLMDRPGLVNSFVKQGVGATR